MELVLHAQQLGGLFLGELVDGDARPHREHLGDGFFVDLVEQVDTGRLDLGLHAFLLTEEFLLAIAQAPGLFEVLGLDGLFLLLGDLGDLVLDLFEVRRRFHALEAQPRAGLVDEVDRLVGQVPVGDVPVGEVGRRDQRLVGDGHTMVLFVAIAQTLEDLDGVWHGRLFDNDLLEPTLECRVLLEVLAILVEGGGTDGLKLASGEHGLEDRGSVDRALGGSCANECVELVDEQDDVAARLYLFEDLLEALLEVASVARPCDESAEVERVELLVLERFGNIVVGDGLSEAFDDGCLADAGLAHQHGVVLGSAAEDLHHALGFAAAADDRVELLVAGKLGEVATKLVEHERAGSGIAAAAPRGCAWLVARAGRASATLATRARVAGQQLDDLLANT